MAVNQIPRAQDDLFAPGMTPRQKYAALIIGRDGWADLLQYELVVLFAQSVPGALGLALRKALYPLLLGSCGRNVVFGQNVALRHPHKIHIGRDVVVDDVFVGRNTILSCKDGDIEISDRANIGFNCEIFSASRVVIGASVLVAA